MLHGFFSVGVLYFVFAVQYVAGAFGIPEELINKIFFGF